jgi:hypothetical protein
MPGVAGTNASKAIEKQLSKETRREGNNPGSAAASRSSPAAAIQINGSDRTRRSPAEKKTRGTSRTKPNAAMDTTHERADKHGESEERRQERRRI